MVYARLAQVRYFCNKIITYPSRTSPTPTASAPSASAASNASATSSPTSRATRTRTSTTRRLESALPSRRTPFSWTARRRWPYCWRTAQIQRSVSTEEKGGRVSKSWRWRGGTLRWSGWCGRHWRRTRAVTCNKNSRVAGSKLFQLCTRT